MYSCLHIIVLVERESAWYTRNIMMPEAALVLLTFVCFLMDVDDIGSRMETAVALLLANIATKFVVSDYMPKVPYRTIVDLYMDACFFNQFFVGVGNGIVYRISQTKWLGGDATPYAILANKLIAFIAVVMFLYSTYATWNQVRMSYAAHAADRAMVVPQSEAITDFHNGATLMANNETPTAARTLMRLLLPKRSRAPVHGEAKLTKTQANISFFARSKSYSGKRKGAYTADLMGIDKYKEHHVDGQEGGGGGGDEAAAGGKKHGKLERAKSSYK